MILILYLECYFILSIVQCLQQNIGFAYKKKIENNLAHLSTNIYIFSYDLFLDCLDEVNQENVLPDLTTM